MVQGLCQRLPHECIVLMHFDSVSVLEEIWKSERFQKPKKVGGGGGGSGVLGGRWGGGGNYVFF